MIMTIQGTGITLTDAIKLHVQEKMSRVEKFFDNIQKIEVDVGKISAHHAKGNVFYAEVNVHIPGTIVRVVKEEPDLYKAIDKVKDHLKVEFEKRKGKMRYKDKEAIREEKAYHNDDL